MCTHFAVLIRYTLGVTVRRVITGTTAEGKGVIVSDESVSPMTLRSNSVDLLWAIDGEAHVPNEGEPPSIRTWFPEPGALRMHIWTKQPDSTMAAPVDDALELGSSATYEAAHPGMHTTDTIDVSMVLSGELWMEIDDGVITHLRPNDVVVQNGTRHRWLNRTETPTRVLTLNVGATRIRA